MASSSKAAKTLSKRLMPEKMREMITTLSYNERHILSNGSTYGTRNSESDSVGSIPTTKQSSDQRSVSFQPWSQ